MHGGGPMTVSDFRTIALSLEGVAEYSHAGLPAFRVGGRKFASLASQAEGYGNLLLTLDRQAAFVEIRNAGSHQHESNKSAKHE